MFTTPSAAQPTLFCPHPSPALTLPQSEVSEGGLEPTDLFRPTLVLATQDVTRRLGAAEARLSEVAEDAKGQRGAALGAVAQLASKDDNVRELRLQVSSSLPAAVGPHGNVC